MTRRKSSPLKSKALQILCSTCTIAATAILVKMVVTKGDIGREVHVVAWDSRGKKFHCYPTVIAEIVSPLNAAVIRVLPKHTERKSEPFFYNRDAREGTWHWPDDSHLHHLLAAFNAQVPADRQKMYEHWHGPTAPEEGLL